MGKSSRPLEKVLGYHAQHDLTGRLVVQDAYLALLGELADFLVLFRCHGEQGRKIACVLNLRMAGRPVCFLHREDAAGPTTDGTGAQIKL